MATEKKDLRPVGVRPPRRLVLISLDGCDFCFRYKCHKCTKSYVDQIDHDTKSGWQFCECHRKNAEESKIYYCMDLTKLNQLVGSTFKVIRSSGEEEVGKWKINECIRTNDNSAPDDYSSHVVILAQSLCQKSITLEEFLKWNNLDLNALK